MKLFGAKNPTEKEEKRQAKSAEEAIAFVHKEAKRRHFQRASFELQWQLNTNFLYGNQHCDINVHRMKVENYQPMYDYLSREVYNRIAPLLETRLANLQTLTYNMTVLPRTTEYEDGVKASVSTALLRAKQESSGFGEKLDAALHWCEMTGSAFFLSGWDARLEDTGDVDYCILTPYEVMPEDMSIEGVEEQNSLLIEQVKSAKEIENRYGVAVKGGSVATLCHRACAGAGGYGYSAATMGLDVSESEDAVVLYTYMEKASAAFPKGRLMIVAEDTLIYNGELPYRSIPVCMMKCQNVPGQFYGKSVIENLIPLQRTYNGIKNKINDYINRTATGQLLIEEGSLDADDLAGNGACPGIPVVYGRGSAKPELLPLPTLPSLVASQCEQIAADMEYEAGVSQLMATGLAPDGITSGTAITALRQIDNTRLSLTGDNIRRAVRRMAVIWLGIYHDYGGKNRAMVASGMNEKEGVIYWSDEEINSFEVVFDTENELRDSGQNRYHRFVSAIEKGLYNTEGGSVPRMVLRKARQCLGIECLGVVLEEDLQEQNAKEENLSFEKGKDIVVGLLDDHSIHLEQHRAYALQRAFRDMSAKNGEKAEKMYAHIAAHQAALKEDANGN